MKYWGRTSSHQHNADFSILVIGKICRCLNTNHKKIKGYSGNNHQYAHYIPMSHNITTLCYQFSNIMVHVFNSGYSFDILYTAGQKVLWFQN